jgi:lysophospholipase L1-like esterase
VYLWYARASIYWKLGDLPIFAPSDYASYSIGPESKTPRTYVAIGDSLTAGVGVDSYVQSYPYIIATEISNEKKEGVKLVPFAIPGIRSEYVVGYFLDPVIASKPDIVTLFIGINDIHGNVPNKVFEEHYEVILQRLTKETDAEIYIVNLPYIGTKDLISAPYRYYFNWRTEQYNSIIKDLGAQYKLTYIDLYSAHTPQALDTTYYARDFFHPNALGYALWAKHIYASFNQ